MYNCTVAEGLRLISVSGSKNIIFESRIDYLIIYFKYVTVSA